MQGHLKGGKKQIFTESHKGIKIPDLGMGLPPKEASEGPEGIKAISIGADAFQNGMTSPYCFRCRMFCYKGNNSRSEQKVYLPSLQASSGRCY